MHPHNLYHLTLRICISRGVRHTSQRSATSPSPFIIIFLEFFFFKSNPRSFCFLLLRKKKSFQSYEPIAILALKHSHSRSYMLFLFVSRVCSMVMPFFILLCLSCRYHHVSAREMIKEAMRSWKKKKRKRKKKDTSSTFRWKRNRMERNNGDRDDRLFRRFFHHRLVIVTAANNFVARSSSQRWAILLRLSHYFFFFPPLPPNFSFIFVSGSMPYHVFEMPEIENG